MITRKAGLFVLVVSLVIGISLGSYGLTSPAPSATPKGDDNNVVSLPPRPLTLNTIDYALKIVGDKVLIPDASRIGPGYRIIGVQILRPPTISTIGAITYNDWALTFVISDLPLTNGTTLNSALAGHYIQVSEASDTGYWNSHDAAVEFMGPGSICHGNSTTQRTCTAASGGTPGQLIQVRNTWLAVYPTGPSTTFYLDGVNRAVSIWGDLSYQQMLAVADGMIP